MPGLHANNDCCSLASLAVTITSDQSIQPPIDCKIAITGKEIIYHVSWNRDQLAKYPMSFGFYLANNHASTDKNDSDTSNYLLGLGFNTARVQHSNTATHRCY